MKKKEVIRTDLEKYEICKEIIKKIYPVLFRFSEVSGKQRPEIFCEIVRLCNELTLKINDVHETVKI